MGVRITGIAEGENERRVASAVAMALGIPLGEAAAYLQRLPRAWPLETTVEEVAGLGLVVEADDEVPAARCEHHPRLAAHHRCVACDARLCAVCFGDEGRCRRCAGTQRSKRRFFRARVAVLLSILAVVLLYAAWDVRRRAQRTSWEEPLDVAIVLVPRAPVDPALIAQMRTRVGILEDRLGEERARHTGSTEAPFVISFHALEGVAGAPPPPTDVDDLIGLARYTWDKRAYLGAVDDRVGLSRGGFDAVIYLVATPAEGAGLRTVEGVGEKGGTIGLVEIDLDASTVDLALFVATHELLHLLGAADLYAPGGDVLVPDGLAEPDLEPRFPQRFAEVMARHRAVGPTESTLPESLDELRIGPVTASAIGWR